MSRKRARRIQPVCRRCQGPTSWRRAHCEKCAIILRVDAELAGCVVVPHVETPLPLPEPTNARPGSQQKMDVLAERVRLGQQLYHPLDCKDVLAEAMLDEVPT